jgi:hypothetical protein
VAKDQPPDVEYCGGGLVIQPIVFWAVEGVVSLPLRAEQNGQLIRTSEEDLRRPGA